MFQHYKNQTTVKILFISSETLPFLEISEVAQYVYNLLIFTRSKQAEVRVLVPQFGVINERQKRLHEVVRLSGVNIPMGREDKPLSIKVSSIPRAKLQVYFINNEDYFHRKSVYHDNKNIFYPDNHERLVFFCKGVLETVKKLEWKADIIHCNDWFTALIPIYLKTNYINDPILKAAKVIFTIYNTYFNHKFDKELLNKIESHGVPDEYLESLKTLDYFGLIKAAAACSEKTVYSNKVIENIIQENTDLSGIQTIEPNENYEESYWQIYESLLHKVQSES